MKEDSLTDEGTFKGHGAAFNNKDSHNDIIHPGAFENTIKSKGRNKNGVAMLLQHGREDITPVGIWKTIEEDEKGLSVIGQLAMKTQRGKETYELLKLKALKGLSIGFDFPRDKTGKLKNGVVEYKNGVRHINEIDLWEISLVTFPANVRATVTGVKDIHSIAKAATNIREFEALLRDEGYSNPQAKATIAYLRELLVKPRRKGADEQLLETLKQANEQMRLKNG